MTNGKERESSPAHRRLEALRNLQESIAARGVDLEAWAREARAIRRDSFSALTQRLNLDDSKPRGN